MYLPGHFAETDVGVLHATMRGIGAAVVVGNGADGLIASHVPIELDAEPGPWGTVRCHFARPNPQIEAASVAAAAASDGSGGEWLLIFQGPQGYVSPNWYPSKQQHGKVVPTWNYVAVHAYGRPRAYDDPAKLRAHLAALTDRFERDSHKPWALDDAPADFIEGMMRAIVGIEIPLSRIEGKWKMSQNRSPGDREGIIAALRARDDDISRAIADLVAERSD